MNPLATVAKKVASEVRRIADTVEAVANGTAQIGIRPIEPENLAADLLEKLAKALRAKRKEGRR